MPTGKYELIVVWADGNKDVYTYGNKEKANEIRDGYMTAFGNQIFFICVNKQFL